MTITDLVARIDQRLADLDTELADLSRARTALIDGAGPRTPAKPRRGRRAAPASRRVVARADKLITLLGGSEAMSTRELSRATNGDPGQVLALLKQQEAAGQVRRSGTRAATRWHLVTDEDRIAARAAELEARSRRTRARRT